jgi:hypothetical protein
MMQPCASAAKLRGGGSILETGTEGHGLLRITTTSDRHRQFVARSRRAPKLLAIVTFDVSPVMTPGAEPYPAVHRQW